MGNREDKILQGGRRGKILFWALLLVLLGIASWVLFWPHGGLQPRSGGEITERDETLSGDHAIVLYFADPNAQNLVTERREVPFKESLEENVEVALRALLLGPAQSSHVAVLPRAARLEQTYYTEVDRTLYLDFNGALVSEHPGGSAAEHLTLSALVRTVGANFPEVARVQLLVDGQAIDTLAGHFDTSKPIEIADWQ